MGKLFRLLLLSALAPFVYALVVEAFVFVAGNITFQSLTWFLAGFALFLAIYVLLPHDTSKAVRLIETFRHEAAHASVSIMFLQMPQIFTVDVRKESAGKVGQTGPLRGWFLAYLAPYYLPLLTLPLLALKPFTPESMHNLMDLLIGVTFSFHCVTVAKDFHFKQKDIRTTGLIFSTVVVILFNIIWVVIILCVVTNSYAGIVDYFKDSVARGLDAYKLVLEVARDKLLPVLERIWEIIQENLQAVVAGVFG